MLLSLPAWALDNQLDNHPSPYLALHAKDTTAWQDWTPAVLEQAKKENKLIFLSSGYFSCHWCHVMQRESFQSEKVARVLNENFIPVKIDREIHRALDSYLIRFVDATRGHTGWPLSVFVTPEGYPLYGTTYQPPAQFLTIVNLMNSRWQKKPEEMTHLAKIAFDELNPPQATQSQKIDVNAATVDLIRYATKTMDDVSGGFGTQNKFPRAPVLLGLLAAYERIPDKALGMLLELTLDNIATQGLRDHVGGGFFRYSIDPQWQIPHFEKMLHTQAMLAQVYLVAAESFSRPEYARIAFETLDFAQREMMEQGLYISSLSAVDNENIEGGAYLWTASQLKSSLSSSEYVAFERDYQLVTDRNLEGGLPILRETKATKTTQNVSLKSLYQTRQVRQLPKDTKALAYLNGMMLTTLSQAAKHPQGVRFKAQAKTLAMRIIDTFFKNKDTGLIRMSGQTHVAQLDDYAFVAEGLYEAGQLLDDKVLSDAAKQLVQMAVKQFYHDGKFMVAKALIPLAAPVVAQMDDALPAPVAVLSALERKMELKRIKPTVYPVISAQEWLNYPSTLRVLLQSD